MQISLADNKANFSQINGNYKYVFVSANKTKITIEIVKYGKVSHLHEFLTKETC